MSERFVEAFIDKLILLEQKTGANVHYRVMPPFTTLFPDYISVQKAAKDIAEFIGLTGYTFIVTVAKQKEKVGGHIDLSAEGTSVFIEIDSEMMKFPDSVGATLCHEISHKWLQRNGIQSSFEIDNEILTDITGVFLGLGKIMLNGCNTVNIRYETTANGTRTITETMKVGYLDRNQLAFVYNLVCAMRKIPPSEFMQGLSAEATHAVRTCNSLYGHHYSPNFHERGASWRSIDRFKGEVTQTQFTMADLDKHLTYIRKSFCETVNAFIQAEHKEIRKLHKNALAMVNETTADPALRFLQAIKIEYEIDPLSDRIRSISQEADGFLKHARQISRHLYRHGHSFPPPSSAMFNIVVCPQDGTKLRLPENSGDLIATCPKCKYRFAYNTSALSFSEALAPRKITWWQKVRNLMRRKKSG